MPKITAKYINIYLKIDLTVTWSLPRARTMLKEQGANDASRAANLYLFIGNT